MSIITSADVLFEMSDMLERCFGANQQAAATAELMQSMSKFGTNTWQPLNPCRHAFADYYSALANALLFVNEIELAELRRADISIDLLLVSVRKRWSHGRCGFSYSCVAGISDDYSYTTAGRMHDQIQAERNGDPAF